MDARQLLFDNFSQKTIKEISVSEPEWLLEHRKKSFALFEQLPLEKSELFKNYINLTGMKRDFRISSPYEVAKVPKNLQFALGKKSEFSIRQIDSKTEANIPKEISEKGVILEDMMTALTFPKERSSSTVRNHTFLEDYFKKKVLPPEEEKMAAFNNAFFNSGFFLYVPENVNVQIPLHNTLLMASENTSVIAQNVIILGNNASATIIDESYSQDCNSLYSNSTEVLLNNGASLQIGSMQNFGSNVVSFVNKKAQLEKDSKISWSSGLFGGSFNLSKTENVLKGDGSEAQDFEVVFGGQTQKFDVASNLRHVGMSTTGRVIVKGVFKDSSRAVIKGMINIGDKAKNTQAYLAEHAILLSKEARADAIPGLEIANNEVKATHSASVAQISEEQIFYLTSRGFTTEEAKKLIVLGFFEPLVRQISLNEVKVRIKALAEMKWNSESIHNITNVSQRIWEEEIVEEKTKDAFEGHYKYR